MSKESLKDKLDGKELDLSLSNLTKVPVKELAALPKATSLDISCNQLTILPDNFTSLIHLVKIDLHKNNLTELPSNFGRLERLQHLDLLGNQLQTLPVSFARLANLRWLDLKENPLERMLSRVVGDCLDDKQCKQCAQRVINHMRAVQAEHDRLRQIQMEQERIQEAAKQEEESKQKQIKKRQKLQEKEKKKKQYEAAQAAKRLQEKREGNEDEEETEETEVRPNGLKTPAKKSSGFSCLAFLLSLLMVLAAVCVGVYFFCETDKTNSMCVDVHRGLEQARDMVQHQIKQWQK